MARSSMAALIARVRILINDTLSVGNGQIFSDDTIQDVLDESRVDVFNGSLTAKPTFSGSSIQYLDYFASDGGWEDDFVLKQYLTVLVTPATSELIVGRWTFAATTLPPVFITGKNYDVWRASADLLERQAAQWVLRYSMTVDGQNLQRGQVVGALLNLAKQYRAKQRPRNISLNRSDIASNGVNDLSLAPTAIDYMSSGDKNR